MKNISQLILLFILICNLSSTNLHAQATQISSSAGTVSMFGDVLVGDSGSSVLQSYLHANRSYECALLQTSYIDQSGLDADDFRVFNTTVTDPNGSPVTVNPNGNVFPQMTKISNLNSSDTNISDSEHARLRYSLIATQTGLHKFTTSDALSNGGFDSYTLRCRETTLYGSYNRFFAETPIVEIQNKSQSSFAVSITIIDAAGTVVVNNQGAVANANTRTDIIFNNLPASNFGQIIITHTAPFGALSGVVAEYDQGANGTIILKRERPLQAPQKS